MHAAQVLFPGAAERSEARMFGENDGVRGSRRLTNRVSASGGAENEPQRVVRTRPEFPHEGLAA